MCSRHYQLRWHGKDPELSVLPAAVVTICLADDCDKASTSHSLCAVHYRAAQQGRLSIPEGSTVTLNAPCSVADCGHPMSSRKSGLCHTHNLMLANKGVVKARQRDSGGQCEWDPECSNPAKTRGMCGTHYPALRLSLGEIEPYKPLPPRVKPMCNFFSCGRPRKSGSEFCRDHNKQFVNHGEVWAIGGGRPASTEPCQFDGCDSPATRMTSLCLRHKNRARNHGMTHGELLELMNGARCAVCGGTDRLVIDHDHSCCDSGKRGDSCGKCIRGVLCNGCNTSLGMLGESQETILNLLAYVQQFQALPLAA